jgi:hypothetical protein
MKEPHKNLFLRCKYIINVSLKNDVWINETCKFEWRNDYILGQ